MQNRRVWFANLCCFVCLPEVAAAATETGVAVAEAWSHNIVDTDVGCLFSCEATQQLPRGLPSSVPVVASTQRRRNGWSRRRAPVKKLRGRHHLRLFFPFTRQRHKRWLFWNEHRLLLLLLFFSSKFSLASCLIHKKFDKWDPSIFVTLLVFFFSCQRGLRVLQSSSFFSIFRSTIWWISSGL